MLQLIKYIKRGVIERFQKSILRKKRKLEIENKSFRKIELTLRLIKNIIHKIIKKCCYKFGILAIYNIFYTNFCE